MSEQLDIEKMVEKGFKELYDKKEQKRETAFADGVRFANLQMWYILKEQENEIEILHSIIKEAINYIKKESWFCYKDDEEVIDRTPVNKLLEILGDNDE